ncbi:MAG: hypothetical protein ACI9OJ_000500 [Myxococcota bacterium]|jgi:hypothetical protein
MSAKTWRWSLVAVMSVVMMIHLPPVENYLDNDDAWNYVLEADLLISGNGSAWVAGGSYLAHQNLQRILPSLSWIPRYAIFDLWMPAWHLPSIIVHGLCALLLVVLVIRLGLSREVGLFAGLLFGLSPLHPHTVSWIGGTYDLFAGAFLLGTLIAFIDRRLVLGLVCCAATIMSKESGVFVGPVLFLYVVFFERQHGLRSAVRRLWPYALVSAGVIGLRLVQIAVGGSIDEAGLPARTIGLNPLDLLVKGPVVLVSALGAPLRDVFPVVPEAFAAIIAGAIVAGIAFRTKVLRHPVVPFCLASAYLLVLPVLLMREEGRALTSTELMHNARYLYLSLLMLTPLVPLAALGMKPTVTGRVLMLAAVLGSSAVTANAVIISTEIEPPTQALAEDLLSRDHEPGAQIFVLANQYDEGPFRLVLSRWLQHDRGATYHWVQRGLWRDLIRRPDRTDGLDFKDFYITPREQPFRPTDVDVARGDKVLLFTNRGPLGEHRITSVGVPSRPEPAPAPPRSLQLQWSRTGAVGATVNVDAHGAVRFQVAGRNDRPGGYIHRPLVMAPVQLRPGLVKSLRLVLTTRSQGLRPDDRIYSRGYVELHWCSEHQSSDDTFVTVPVAFHGQQVLVDVPLWFDPVWLDSGDITCLGFAPLDIAGDVTLHAIDVITVASP